MQSQKNNMSNHSIKTIRLKLMISIVEIARFAEIKMTDYADWEEGKNTKPLKAKEKENILGKLQMKGATSKDLQQIMISSSTK